MKKISATLFVVILFGFSAILVVFSLFASIKLAALDDTASGLSTRILELKEENRVLLTEVERLVSLDAVEKYAFEVLGMCRCTGEQIEYINITEYINTSEQVG